jgi:hypothetical protein
VIIRGGSCVITGVKPTSSAIRRFSWVVDWIITWVVIISAYKLLALEDAKKLIFFFLIPNAARINSNENKDSKVKNVKLFLCLTK